MNILVSIGDKGIGAAFVTDRASQVLDYYG